MSNFVKKISRYIKHKIGRFFVPVYMSGKNQGKILIFHYNADSVYAFNDHKEIDSLWEKWTAGNRKNNAGDYFRYLQFILNAKYVLRNGVEGDFAELGVYKGNSSALLAHFAREAGRTMYCFDTFEGFDAADIHGIDKAHKIQFRDTSLDYVKSIVGEKSVKYIKGRFPDSLKEAQIKDGLRFAVVSLDCDLYDPIKAGLAYFYPRLAMGGNLCA